MGGLGAQSSVKIKTLSQKDGLSQGSVFAIAQDTDGFLWFGTRDGLNKYNGHKFKVFKHDDHKNSLVSNDIRSLFVEPDSSGLWIGTTEGLSFLDKETMNFQNYTHNPLLKNTLSNDLVRTIFRDSKGRLWIGTSRGLNLYNTERDDFTTFSSLSHNYTSQDIFTLTEDADGTLWIGTDKGLYYLSGSESIEFISADLSITNVTCIAESAFPA